MGAIDECHRPGTRGLLQTIVADAAESMRVRLNILRIGYTKTEFERLSS
jgi:hypothetical protein